MQHQELSVDNLQRQLQASNVRAAQIMRNNQVITPQITQLEKEINENKTARKKARKHSKKKKLNRLIDANTELEKQLAELQTRKSLLQEELDKERQFQSSLNEQIKEARQQSHTEAASTEPTPMQVVSASTESEDESLNEDDYDKAVRLFTEQLSYDQEEAKLKQVFDYERPAIRDLYTANRQLLIQLQAEKNPDRAYHAELLNAARELLNDYKNIDHQQHLATLTARNVNGKPSLPLIIAGIVTAIIGLALVLTCPPLYIMGYITTAAMLAGSFGAMGITIAGCFIGAFGERRGTAKALQDVQAATREAANPPLPLVRTFGLFHTVESRQRFAGVREVPTVNSI